MDRKHILELALEALESKRADIEAAIAEIRELENARGEAPAGKPHLPVLVLVKRKSKTRAQRLALSRKMKAVWAAKKASAKKPRTVRKGRPKSAAEKKALSLKMKQVWAKKRAEAAKKS